MKKQTSLVNKINTETFLFLAGYFFGRIPNIRLISNAGYPVPARYLAIVRYPANYRISGRITGFLALKKQPGIRPDIRPNPIANS